MNGVKQQTITIGTLTQHADALDGHLNRRDILVTLVSLCPYDTISWQTLELCGFDRQETRAHINSLSYEGWRYTSDSDTLTLHREEFVR